MLRLNCELAPNSVPLGLLSFGALAEFDGALTQEFDAARRAESQEAFAVTRETASIGGDLNVVSVQDSAISKSSSAGFSASVSLSASKNDNSDGSITPPNKTSVGGGGGVSVGKSNASSAIVTQQTALIARGGSLEGYGDSALNYLKLSALFLFAACRAEGSALTLVYDAFEL